MVLHDCCGRSVVGTLKRRLSVRTLVIPHDGWGWLDGHGLGPERDWMVRQKNDVNPEKGVDHGGEG